MNWKKWMKDTGLKAVKTMAQTALGVIGSTALITDVNWQVVASTVVLSGIACILMNIANLEVSEVTE